MSSAPVNAPESPGLSENHSWVTDCASSCLFVKPPLYLELEELTATPMGLTGCSLRNIRIREIKWKKEKTQPNCACAGLNVPAEPCEQSRDKKEAAQALLGSGSSWAPSGALPAHQNEPKRCEIRYTQLCSALENSRLGWFGMYWGTRLSPNGDAIKVHSLCIEGQPDFFWRDVRIPGGPCPSAYACF